jgi:hypothetical protein
VDRRATLFIKGIMMENSFTIDIQEVHPSQLYISKLKLTKIQESLDPKNPVLKDPIPIKELNGKTVFVDGHTRAVALYLLGQTTMEVYWEDEELDWEVYEICVQWCKDESIFSIAQLSKRIVTHKEYEIVWYKRCDELHQSIEEQRKKRSFLH